MPVLIAPMAGRLVDRLGGRPLLVTGLALQAVGIAWIAVVTSPTVAFSSLVLPFVLAGVGMSLFFVPVATVVMNSVPANRQGVASGTNNAIREVGGVFGVAVLATISVMPVDTPAGSSSSPGWSRRCGSPPRGGGRGAGGPGPPGSAVRDGLHASGAAVGRA